MNLRETSIRESEFFTDKQDLASQIINFEHEGKGYLPNAAKHAVIPPSALQFGNKQVTIGRIENYYFFGIEVEMDNWKYKAFEDEGMCAQYFHDTPGIDKETLSFWKLQIKRLSEQF